MVTDKGSWAAGYTTTSAWDQSETFTGKLHTIPVPTERVKYSEGSLHKIEGELLDFAKALGGAAAVKTLRTAAETVHRATGLQALVARKHGKPVGAILLVPVKVQATVDPIEYLQYAVKAGETIPDNLQRALRPGAQ